MKARAFFIVALILAILALCAHLWAMGFATRSLQMRARAVAGSPAEKTQALAEAKAHARQYPFFYYAGLSFASSSVALLVVSARRREPVSRAVPLGLLAGYVLLQLLLMA